MEDSVPDRRSFFEVLSALKAQHRPTEKKKKTRKKSRPRLVAGDPSICMSLTLRTTDMEVVDAWCQKLKCTRADLLRCALECMAKEFNLPKIPQLWNVKEWPTQFARSRNQDREVEVTSN